MRRNARHIIVAKKDPALIGNVKARDAAQQRRLAATARPEQEKNLALSDAQVDSVERHRFAKSFAEIFDRDRNHVRPES